MKNNKSKKKQKNKDKDKNKNIIMDKRDNPFNFKLKKVKKNTNNLFNYNDSKRKKKIKNKKEEIELERESKRNIISQNSKIIQSEKNKIEYTEEEKNRLPYELALQYDKRTYCEYYISLIKTKHNLVFSFCYNEDYNSRIIKIDIFFLSFGIYYTINALFFDDDAMHKIYENKGKFNFEYQIPKIVYSSFISMALNMLLKLLALSNDAILNFKKEKILKEIAERKTNLINNLLIKFVFYFILSFLFLGFFWYYISMFGAIYRNTQMHLLKDTLISFGLSFVYPFFIYLLPGFARIPSLSDEKGNRKYLYQFSKFLQFF